MNKLTQVIKRFKVHPEYAGWDIDDLLLVMDNEDCVFCAEFLRSGGNGSKAGRAVRLLNPDVKEPRDAKHLQRMASGKTLQMLARPSVSTYLYLKLSEMREKAQLDSTRSFEAYIRKYEDIREAALEDGDYAPALKAHKDLGILYGHTEQADKQSGINDKQLVLLIAGEDKSLASKLMKQLGHDAIEGELVE